MSHQRYPSHDPIKEPHSISLKVLRLSRPSLVAQHPIPSIAPPSTAPRPPPVPASLAYTTIHDTNPSPFILSPILNLPPSFGSAYVGETFSCTLCANHEVLDTVPPPAPPPATALTTTDAPTTAIPSPPINKFIRDVRIEAEMKTPATGAVTKLELTPPSADGGIDLQPGQTLQRIVNFDLKDEGNHVLGVTVSYYEATETSGRTRTFRKLYQFICKPSLIVRTKASPLASSPLGPEPSPPSPPPEAEGEDMRSVKEENNKKAGRRRWVLEAQLENCSEDTMELERVALELEEGLTYRDCNWETSGSPQPVVHSGEVEQVCFVIEEQGIKSVNEEEGRIVFGVLGIGWRGEMGSRGYLATGKLGTRHV